MVYGFAAERCCFSSTAKHLNSYTAGSLLSNTASVRQVGKYDVAEKCGSCDCGVPKFSYATPSAEVFAGLSRERFRLEMKLSKQTFKVSIPENCVRLFYAMSLYVLWVRSSCDGSSTSRD